MTPLLHESPMSGALIDSEFGMTIAIAHYQLLHNNDQACSLELLRDKYRLIYKEQNGPVWLFFSSALNSLIERAATNTPFLPVEPGKIPSSQNKSPMPYLTLPYSVPVRERERERADGQEEKGSVS